VQELSRILILLLEQSPDVLYLRLVRALENVAELTSGDLLVLCGCFGVFEGSRGSFDLSLRPLRSWGVGTLPLALAEADQNRILIAELSR